MRVAREVLARLVEGSGHVRKPTLAQGFKEWLHFCVLGDELELLANFSFMGDVARVILLARVGRDGPWLGDVETIPSEQVRHERGRIDLDFGHNTLRFREGAFELSILLSDRPLALRLRLEPETVPLLRPNTPLDSGPIHWFVVPRLRAHGVLDVGGERHRIDGARAYHDHNWGTFAWGDDFGWQWGFGLPNDPASPFSMALVRLVDRGRARDLGHGLFLWNGAVQQRIFREGELFVRARGLFTPKRFTKMPRVMALLAPERTTDVPERISIEAQAHGDHVVGEFVPDDLLQIILPNDRDLGLTIINEVSGTYRLEGRVGGAPVEMEGRGYFELLTT